MYKYIPLYSRCSCHIFVPIFPTSSTAPRPCDLGLLLTLHRQAWIIPVDRQVDRQIGRQAGRWVGRQILIYIMGQSLRYWHPVSVAMKNPRNKWRFIAGTIIELQLVDFPASYGADYQRVDPHHELGVFRAGFHLIYCCSYQNCFFEEI